MTNASEDDVLLSIPEGDLTSSPSSVLCSSEPAETEEKTNKKEISRKSLVSLLSDFQKLGRIWNLNEISDLLFTYGFLLSRLSAC